MKIDLEIKPGKTHDVWWWDAMERWSASFIRHRRVSEMRDRISDFARYEDLLHKSDTLALKSLTIIREYNETRKREPTLRERDEGRIL